MKWLSWGGVSILLSVFWGWSLFAKDQNARYLIGETTDGHHQIELACNSCHVAPFGGVELIQEACTSCHGAELALAEDSHPKSKFTDPRNAARVDLLDARYCATCHIEHRKDETHAMGVTLPEDFCFYCHEDIAEERPTHENVPFTDCLNSGCHNYHDNKALYEDFLVKHADQPALGVNPHQPARNLLEQVIAEQGFVEPMTQAGADHPASLDVSSAILDDWLQTAHAQAGISCQGCHQGKDADDWVEKPGLSACQTCHQMEAETFMQGKHGMRLAVSDELPLSPMTPAMGRLPFKLESIDTELSCTTCHGAHRFDAQKAAVESCLGCHNDEHSLNYQASPHALLHELEVAGQGNPGTGVTCATCHMPRLEGARLQRSKPEGSELEAKAVQVMHNQNDNLRPNEKMIRSVCMDCHGFPFVLDALADPELIRSNFNGQPSVHVKSIEWATER
ncbi:cytochrome c3 family protein [Hahella ganghwensis]|uniref:cytochrome c3 family protein n=1 Tax=Hahella ganghwensis TaxID=286420 RepID=UPI000362D8F6|nr:cytochrome c3 family protein [Hahella ganghwensis]